ncbi:MAG: nucleotidyltransferase family protein [Massilia sp.]
MSSLPLLVRAFREPAAMAGFNLAEWDLLLRQSVSANLSASILGLVDQHDLMDRIPAEAREHLEWARTLALRHSQGVRWEIACIARALAPLGLPLILLKGGAYAAAGLPPARGRLFSDIDLLVPEQRLPEVEARLMLNGWAATHLDDYDQRYYRQWMHELPPMRHIKRQSLIDVHHAILPKTAALRPDPAKLRAAAVPLAGQPGLWTLAPADMLLHSAVHLFCDGEFDKGLRDLVDIDRLLRHFGTAPAFWAALPARAVELDLARPLFYALRYSARLLGTPVPPAALAAAEAGCPNAALLALMDALFLRALLPLHASCADRLSGAARFALYLRGNWLRMPPLMLARHLFHKAFLSPKDGGPQTEPVKL